MNAVCTQIEWAMVPFNFSKLLPPSCIFGKKSIYINFGHKFNNAPLDFYYKHVIKVYYM